MNPKVLRAFALVCVFSIAAAVLTGAPSVAAPNTVPIVGVNFHGGWHYVGTNTHNGYTDAQRQYVLDQLTAAQVGWIRMDIGWATIQQNGQNDYQSWYINFITTVVRIANAETPPIKVLGTVLGTPCWANGQAGCNPADNKYDAYPPTQASYYASIAETLAKWYNGTTINPADNKPYGKIDAWEAWNEPDQSDFFDPQAGTPAARALHYVNKILIPSHGTTASPSGFKKGNPNALVVLGAPTNNRGEDCAWPCSSFRTEQLWLNMIYEDGGKSYFDVMATHPYLLGRDLPPEVPDTSGSDIFLLSHLPAIHSLMARYGDGGKEIWLTEFGWSSTAPTSTSQPNSGVEDGNWNCGVSRWQQSKYLTRALKFLRDNNYYDLYHVTHAFEYDDRDWDFKTGAADELGNPTTYTPSNRENNNFGLFELGSNSDTSFNAKPDYGALKNFLAGQMVPDEEEPTSTPPALLLLSGSGVYLTPAIDLLGQQVSPSVSGVTPTVTVNELARCRSNAYFRVSNTTSSQVTVAYTTENPLAGSPAPNATGSTYGVDADYMITTGRTTLDPNKSKIVTVPVSADWRCQAFSHDPQKFFYLTVRDTKTPGTFPDAQGKGVINDNLCVPFITSFTPGSGPAGTVVSITGALFYYNGDGTGPKAVQSVTFKTNSGTISVPPDTSSITDTNFRVAVPTCAVTGTFTVNTPWGSVQSANPITVTTAGC